MKYELLGPVRAHTGDGWVAFQPQGELFLASLLLAEGRRVGHDRLVECVWGDAPPSDPPDQLRRLALQVRDTLRRREVIRTEPGGYGITVGREELDVFRFREKVAQAETADTEDAVPLLQEALGEWGGSVEPLPGRHGTWVDSVRRTLQEERREAQNALFLAELRSGGNPNLAADIRGTIDERSGPEDDLRVLLIAAQFRSDGRWQGAADLEHVLREADRKGVRASDRLLRVLRGPGEEVPRDEERARRSGPVFNNTATGNARVGNQGIANGPIHMGGSEREEQS
ncbi:AfsR/SARP family transcriptional regulator [Actinomadura chibensis]|uniref:AfsR/SARP family transcriptional regulator n=1 Tax=Actinomadura chibensis TaxID=392828 RepID=UPI00082A9BE6|nr:BTAD domain-containing putative transcriptional regulator [Actinomadura chibensis]